MTPGVLQGRDRDRDLDSSSTRDPFLGSIFAAQSDFISYI